MAASGNQIAQLERLHPTAATPGGEVSVVGTGLGPHAWQAPQVFVGDTPARIALASATRLVLRVANGTVSGEVRLANGAEQSNGLPLHVAVPIAQELHTVSNPAADADGNLFVAFSGDRGQQVATSVYKIDAEYNLRPHGRGILNATGLSLDAEQNLYVSSRQEGTIYKIAPTGAMSIFAEGMGVATGLAFDAAGNLFCGDRSGTIFKIAPDRQIFVYATLEPSVAAFHLCMAPSGTLYVTAPTTGSFENVYAVDPDGTVRTFYSGLGRPQGMVLTPAGDLLVAASLHGARGVVRITPQGLASLAVAGPGILGLANLPDGGLALATSDTVYYLRN